MTRQFQVYLDPESSAVNYSCVHCRAHLADHNDLISKSFQGSQGRAYLFDKVVNVKQAGAEDRLLLTGQHRVADLHCACCAALLGWTYERAFEPSQRYKEGKSVIELANLIKENQWSKPENQRWIKSKRYSSGYYTSSSNVSLDFDEADRGQENIAFLEGEEDEQEIVATQPHPSTSTFEEDQHPGSPTSVLLSAFSGLSSSPPSYQQQQTRSDEINTLQRRPRATDQKRHRTNQMVVRSADVLSSLCLRSTNSQCAQPQATSDRNDLSLNNDNDGLLTQSFSAWNLDNRFPSRSLPHRSSFRQAITTLTDQTIPLLSADEAIELSEEDDLVHVSSDPPQDYYLDSLAPNFAQVAVQQEEVSDHNDDVFCAVFE